MLREWMADEELRESIAKEDSDQAHAELTTEALSDHLLNHLLLADAMLSSVTAPRRWLVGIEPLSRPGDELLGDDRAAARLRNYYLEPEVFFFQCLLECLDSQWQYEITPIPGLENFRVVSGVSIAGLLSSVAGTYVSEGASNARDLCALRALPLDPGLGIAELPAWIAAQPILSSDGFTPPPASQRLPFTTIRGEIAGEVVDFVSGTRLRLAPHTWLENPPSPTDWANWWIGTLPRPAELESTTLKNDPGA
jgi:hypothetical protein